MGIVRKFYGTPIKMGTVANIPGSRYLADLTALAFVCLIQAAGLWWIWRERAAVAAPWIRRTILACGVASFGALNLGFLLGFLRVSKHFTMWWPTWGRGFVIIWALLSVVWVAGFALLRGLSFATAKVHHSSARRGFLRLAQAAVIAVPAAAVGYGVFVQRFRLSLREQAISIPDLPPDLDGLRLVQITDIHLSPFLSERELERAIAMANETRAHIALVTGDLTTAPGDPLDACINQLARLRADAGIFGCLGNHEIYARSEHYVTARGAEVGMRFLRSAATNLRFGNATLNLAGVDYQRFGKPYLRTAGKLVQPGAFNLLLSHNPDVFPVAAAQGYQLTIAGHTHGGQVRVEILHQDLNIARFFTRYVDGLYRKGSSSIFVSRGLGTIGMPVRLGAPPEVALIRLCRT